MKISLINKRKAYTNDELIKMLKNKMIKDEFDINDLYEKYSEFFVDQKKLIAILDLKINFDYETYKFLEAYLNIPINELTKIIGDDTEEVSARGDVDSEFLRILNYLFDQMIKHRNFNSSNSNTFKDYLMFSALKDDDINNIVHKIKKYLNIFEIPVNLFDIIEKQEGFYILKFPNDLGVSGLTIIKNSRKEDEKYVCIYVNTNESKGRLNFTLAHELYHVLIERSCYQASFMRDEKSDKIEKRAEEFASKLIIPRDKLLEFIRKNIRTSKHRNFKIDDIIQIQNYFNVSFQAVVYVLSSSLKRDEIYKEYVTEISKIPEEFMKYYNNHRNPKIQEELLKKTGDKTIFNFIEDCFQKPKLFLQDLDKSYSRHLISLEEYKMLNSFFYEED